MSLQMIEWKGLDDNISSQERYVSLIFGVLLVVFFSALGWGIDNATAVIDLSSQLTTITQSASVGLGTGYYFGATLTEKETSRRWVLFGIFSSVAIGAIITSLLPVFSDSETVNLLQPAVILAGGLVSIFANITPAVQTNEQYKKTFSFISGYLTTGLVILLASIDYLITLFKSASDFIVGNVPVYIFGGVLVFIIGFTAALFVEDGN
jgi:hypothetical protein